MKKIISAMIAIALLMSFAMVSSGMAEEAGTITYDGYTCRFLHNGNLIVEKYTLDAEGKTVNIPSEIYGHDIERIGRLAFDGCKMAAVTIPTTVRVIEALAFNGCTEIQKVEIPNNVLFIDGNPFTGCEKLVNISLDPKHPTMRVTSDGALYSKKNHMLLCYLCSKTEKSYTVKDGTLAIGKDAFSGCGNLESILLPSTVLEICDEAFSGCTRLKSISLPGSILSIGEMAFSGCVKLQKAEIPAQVSRIEKGTFSGCQGLTSVTLPENLTYISDRAFRDCAALQEIQIPETVNCIGEEAFFGCESLTRADVPVAVTQIGGDAFANCSMRLYLHVQEYSYAELYAKLYGISFTYGNQDKFLTEPVPADADGLQADEIPANN